MKKILPGLLIIVLVQAFGYGQTNPAISKWIQNSSSKTSSWWQNTASGGPPSYSYYTSSDLADVLKVCYTADSVWVNANGMTNDMGKYLNPGACKAQNYIYRFPLNPSVPSTKTISPKGGAIGLLVNGIPIYGLSNSYSYKNSTGTNTNMGGDGIWNMEVYLSEGFVLDTAFGAHPQQQGAYHSHATPWRLYKSTPATQHSPLIGFAFDGYPVYGPYGYSSPLNASSSVTRMKTGYSLRNITNRQTLPYGVALSPSQYGPSIASYALGTYCEDYEWLASNGGDLDKYNGRFCVTPEYPGGTYAYFVTQSSTGVPQFPYYIGIQYYGAPDTKDLVSVGNTGTTLTFPTSGTTCLSNVSAPVELVRFTANATNDKILLQWTTASEQNSSHFELLESTDGIHFSSIGSVQTHGNSSTLQNYTYEAFKTSSGTIYYKLLMVDMDGSTQESDVRSLKQFEAKAFITRTVFEEETSLVVPADCDAFEYTILTMMGSEVAKASVHTSDVLPIGQTLPPACYLVCIKTNSSQEIIRIHKVR